TVLVLEAGGPPEGDEYECRVPAFHTLASEKASMSWRYFVRHYANDTQQRKDSKYCAEHDGVFYPRAGTLGGCTAHNAIITLYRCNEDWDAIANETNDPSWRAVKMRQHFQTLERCQYRRLSHWLKRLFGWDPSRHGYDGWLDTSYVDPLLVSHDRAIVRIIADSALKEFHGLRQRLTRFMRWLKTLAEPSDWRSLGTEGVRLTPLNTCNGHR